MNAATDPGSGMIPAGEVPAAALRTALHAAAVGSWPEEAAVRLVTATTTVWQLPVWQQLCVTCDRLEQDGVSVLVAEIDWSTAVEAARAVRAPLTQVALVRIAAAVAAGGLGAALRDVREDDLVPVLEAVAHAMTGPLPGRPPYVI